MKKLIALLIVMLSFEAFAMGKAPKGDAFESSPAFSKMDLRLREAWKASENDGGGEVLECMLKLKAKPSDADKKALRSAGFSYRTVIGQIVTGSLKAEDVPSVAGLDIVEVMELAVPMTLKKK